MTFDEIYNTLKIDTSFLTSSVYQNIKEQLRTNTLPNGDNRYIGFIEFKQNRILIYTNQTNNTLIVRALPNFQLSVKSDKIYTYDNIKDLCLQEFYQQIKLHLAYVINYELLNENIDSIDLIYPQVLIINTDMDTPPYTPPPPKPPKPVDKTYKLSELYPTTYTTMKKVPSAKLLQKRINANDENIRDMFKNCSSLISAPLLDIKTKTILTDFFYNCTSLKEIPAVNTSNVLYFNNTFFRCKNIKTVPKFNTKNAINFVYAFHGCIKLLSVPEFDTSKVEDMLGMFACCESLTNIPKFNTSKVVNMNSMLTYCSSLEQVPEFNTEKVTNMGYMFQGCKKIMAIPKLNTTNVTTMENMFSGCSELKEVPEFNTEKVTNMCYMFSGCSELKEVPIFDISSIREASAVYNMFWKTKITSVTFRNKPNNIEITSKLLCGEENQIIINYV